MSSAAYDQFGDALPSARSTGLLIGVASILSVAFMAFHPQIVGPHSQVVEEFHQKALINGVVHGSLIALVAVLFLGFSGLASRLGMGALDVRGGLIAYGIGTIFFIAAALINGFMVPAFVARFASRPPEALELMKDILALAHYANQMCSRLGVLALSVATILWSLAFLRHMGSVRVVGILGCVLSVALVVGVLSGHLAMNVHGMMVFELAHTLWSLAVAGLLLRQRL